MLIGAHVSTAGGLPTAVERGVERGCDSIQIFNQSPRTWRPTRYGPDDHAAFREAFEGSRLGSVVIHASYLINCANPEREIRAKSLNSLVHALRLGDGIAADGVILHAGSKRKDPHARAIARAGKLVGRALAQSESCPILFENTAGTTGPLGRDFGELSQLIEAAGAGDRVGACLDCCHLLASGFEIRTVEALAGVVDEFDATVGLDRLRALHVNDSAMPLGSNRDRHANLPDGELGRDGLAAFLSEPRFEGLPAILEVPGPDRRGPDRRQVQIARRLRRRGLEMRARA